MNQDQQRIRELAYQIWESEGRPSGQEQRHWQMACKLLHSEQQGDLQPAPKKKPATRKPRAKPATAPAEEASRQEKPALLEKPAAAKKPSRPRRQAITRTTKITEPGKPDAGQQE